MRSNGRHAQSSNVRPWFSFRSPEPPEVAHTEPQSHEEETLAAYPCASVSIRGEKSGFGWGNTHAD